MITSEIEQRLKTPGAFDESMINDNAPPKLTDVLNRYMGEKNLSKADVIRILNVERNYGYQLLSGIRPPTRNCLIQISLILQLDVKQITELLRLAEKPPLYVRNVVDARVFYAVEHRMEYFDAVEFIWGKGGC